MLVEVVINKETRQKQGIMGWQYHSRTAEHIVGYKDGEGEAKTFDIEAWMRLIPGPQTYRAGLPQLPDQFQEMEVHVSYVRPRGEDNHPKG